MKRMLILVLLAALAVGMAVPAAAVGSPVAPTVDPAATSPLPEVVLDPELEGYMVVELFAVERAGELGEAAQTSFADSQSALEEATPEGMTAQYFFYITAYYVNVDGTHSKVTEPFSVGFKIDNISEAVVKQFVNGEWIELETTISEDGIVMVKNAQDAPMAIFTKPLA